MSGAKFSLDALLAFEPERALEDVARCAGYSRTAMRRATERGWLTTEQADHIAVSLGIHPFAIWGFDYWAESAADEPHCAHCGEPAPIANRRGDNAWCSERCRGAHARARWREKAARYRAARAA